MRFLGFGCALVAAVLISRCSAQSYKVVEVRDGGTITGTVKWSGPLPHLTQFPINKDQKVCDPESRKTTDLERLLVGANLGVANTVVYLKNIPAGKAFGAPDQRQHLDQRHCQYIPHVLLVPEKHDLAMQSSDATLHTVHMEGAATYNLPFPFPNQVTSRSMSTSGLVTLRCNGGHVWMNAEMFVIPHPYYAVTDDSGRFELNDVPPGTYQLIAWHEGWMLTANQQTLDVLTEAAVKRPIFSEPRTWEKTAKVLGAQFSTVNFLISAK
jgi:hypothetical protein